MTVLPNGRNVPAPTIESAIAPPSLDNQYFLEIALGSEYGSGGHIRKWTDPVVVTVEGVPTDRDRQTLAQVIRELRQLTGHPISEGANGNITIHFAPESQFAQIEPNYRPQNMGFFWLWWQNFTINRAVILIASEGVTQTERSHLIREELTQSLGLAQDSDRYPGSIFYGRWTETTEYSPHDKGIIQTLYRDDIRPGMNRQQVEAVLN